MSFTELKLTVEKIISNAYPNSLPFITISSVGIFEVQIKGEVPQTQFVTAWGLSRLSELIEENLGPYSSIRQIGIISKEGGLKKYDLFKAFHQGISTEDPFIKPGDTIIVYRRDREIEIHGEVYRPGKYQILKNEGLKDVLEEYAGGFTKLADISRIKLDRLAGDIPQTLYLDLTEGYERFFRIEDEDVITVPSKLTNLPIVIFEGAIGPAVTEPPEAADEDEEEALEIYNRLTYSFKEGETLYDALQAIRESISPLADLANAYLVRGGSSQIIPVNIEKLLYSYLPGDDIVLHPLDRVVIPAQRFYVSVLGAVGSPGNYQYVPQKTYSYYMSLAGGIPSAINDDNISIIDARGRARSLTEIIQPEDRIIITESLIPVAGAVYSPGSYPFIPGKTHSYYLDLAGGIGPELNTNNNVSITDSLGNTREPDDIIQPGDKIFVHTSSFVYNFNRHFPIITTSMAFIITLISIINLLVD